MCRDGTGADEKESEQASRSIPAETASGHGGCTSGEDTRSAGKRMDGVVSVRLRALAGIANGIGGWQVKGL
jgi:hypothetical protein